MLLSACSGQPAISSWPGVTAGQDLVYVAYSSYVRAIKPDGNQAWRYPADAEGTRVFYARPVVAGDQLIVGDYEHTLHGIDAATGSPRWRYADAKARYVGAVLALEDLIVAPNADHNVYALNSQGQFSWKFTTAEPVWAQPVSDGTNIYIASMDHSVYSLTKSGNQVWKTDVGAAVIYSLAISDDGKTLYAGTLANELVALDAASGSVTWRAKTEGNVWGRPVIHENTLIFGDQTGKIYAVDAAGGAEKWRFDAGAAVVATGVLLDNGVAFPVEDGKVILLDFNGARLWEQPVNGKLYSSPVFTGEHLMIAVTSAEHLLVSLNSNGTQAWEFIPPK